MAQITPQQLDGTGTDPSLVSANAGGDSVEVKRGDYSVVIILENTSTNNVDVTIASQASNLGPGLAASDLVVTVPASGLRMVMIPKDEKSNLTDGSDLAQLTYATASAINVGAVQRR